MTLVDSSKFGWLLRIPKWFFWALGFSVVVCYGCDRGNNGITELNGSSLGTTYSVKIPSPLSSEKSEEIHEEIKIALDEIDQSMSVFYEDSEISRFNLNDGSSWFKLSPAMFEVVREAARISEISDGAFDFTLGNLIELWGFGNKVKLPSIPSILEIEKAIDKSGYSEVQLNAEIISIRKNNPQIALNLSAIAKGYAVDRVTRILDYKGLEHYLVEIGGEIRVRGQKKVGNPWMVAIERPDFSKRSIQKILKLRDNSMATSGDYRNYFEVEGKRFSHTMNAKTGRPVENNIASVSVISDSCMEADALATALMAMGYDKGRQFAEKQQLSAFWILRIDAVLSEEMTPQFEQYLK